MGYDSINPTTTETVVPIPDQIVHDIEETGERLPSLSRSSSCPSLYETDDEDGTPIPKFEVPVVVHQRERSHSISTSMPRRKNFKSKLLKAAGQVTSTSVYERMYHDSESEDDIGSEAEGYWDTTDWESDTETRRRVDSNSEEQPLLVTKPKRHEEVDETKPHGNGKRKTVFTIVKSFVASGILFLPYGFNQSGIILGCIIVVSVGILSLFGMLLLLDTKDKLYNEGKKVTSFGDIGFRAFGWWGRFWVDTAVFFAQMGFCCAYFNFIGNNVRSLITLMSNCKYEDDYYNYVVLVIGVISVPLVWIRKLKHFAITNIIADLLILGPLAYILIQGIVKVSKDGPGPELEMFNFRTCWAFIGTTVYSMEGIAMVIPIEQSARDKKEFRATLKWSVFGIILLQMTFGSICYLCYGADTQAIITLNLGDPSRNVPIVDAIKICFCIALLFTLPLMMFPAVKISESKIFKKERRSGKKLQKNLWRIFLLALCGGIAVLSSDKVDSLVSIIGGVSCVPMAFVFPAMFHYKICCTGPTSIVWFRHRYTKMKIAKIMNILLFIVGVVCAIFSTSIAIYQWVTITPAVEPPCIPS